MSRTRRLIVAGAGGAVLIALVSVAVHRTRPDVREPVHSAPATTPPRATVLRTTGPRSVTPPPSPATAPAPSAEDIIRSAWGALLGSPQIDPRQPGYDPVAAHELHGGGDVRGLFMSEPRDEAWAAAREADIASFLLPELLRADPAATLEVECRTATCRLRRRSPTALTDLLGDYPLVCLARRTTPMWGTSRDTSPTAADPYLDYFLMFGRETRDRDGFIERRGTTCADFREEWQRQVGDVHGG